MAIAREKSITKAAESLYISQPAASSILKKLVDQGQLEPIFCVECVEFFWQFDCERRRDASYMYIKKSPKRLTMKRHWKNGLHNNINNSVYSDGRMIR
ncbi:MAG: LysR family transcriptional regulator [Lachnospiraceae bacterium]|nr:LysR family transcriptional regulator [Lachnospiraceae bacterium]